MKKLLSVMVLVMGIAMATPAMATPVVLIWGYGILYGSVFGVSLWQNAGRGPVVYPKMASGADGINTCYEPSQYADRCQQNQPSNPNIVK